ncbi:MAG: trigger factor [Bacteroidales bacterium]
MNIVQEHTGELTTTIKIELQPLDYEQAVDKALKDIQRKATHKGFRPGKVPFGMIRQMYGKAALAEEINKILSNALDGYIAEQKLEILGYPLANEEKNGKIDFDTDTQFAFYFDVGLAPSVDFDLSAIENDYHMIQIEDEKVEDYLQNIRKQFGNPTHPESTQPGDLLKGRFMQLDQAGEIMESGWTYESSFSIAFIKDELVQDEMIGKKVGDTIRFNPLKATGNEKETAEMLGVQQDNRPLLESDYAFTLDEISRIEPAEVNRELFQKVYPKDEIETDEQFRDKIRDESKDYLQKESDHFFVHEAMEKITRLIQIQLPDDFLKRWLVQSDEKITEDKIAREYDLYANSLKQQLIISRIAKDHGIKIEETDIRNHLKESISKYYMIDEADEAFKENLDRMATSMMQNKEEVNKVYERLYDDQIRQVLKEKMKLNLVEISYDKFIEKVNEHHKHFHHHEHEE